ncbi:hypothetical protein [Paenibacillus sp. tmac-D7]|uniref:hypothetical protein n=1 Tax=Paenibacillus sp. tmac-D7 TaxID=2591462 RepID=UPI0011428DCF|nr:hypothetical protein [Paenibacillus sp. tmac-D7]
MTKLRYTYDEKLLSWEEQNDGEADVEFWLRLSVPDANVEKGVKAVRDYFDHNDVLTDVLFYAHHNAVYQWIVRRDFYEAFVIRAFEHKLLTSLVWE